MGPLLDLKRRNYQRVKGHLSVGKGHFVYLKRALITKKNRHLSNVKGYLCDFNRGIYQKCKKGQLWERDVALI